jgi:hypothetical protein
LKVELSVLKRSESDLQLLSWSELAQLQVHHSSILNKIQNEQSKRRLVGLTEITEDEAIQSGVKVSIWFTYTP